MKVMCAWCGRSLGEKPPYSDTRISHGICRDCYDEQLGRLDATQAVENAEQRSIQLQRYLDTDDNVIGAKIEVAHDERIVANLEGDVEVAKAKVAGARARFRALICELDMRRALVEAGAELEQAI